MAGGSDDMPEDATKSSSYALATGRDAVKRLHVLHDIYAPAGRRVLLQAGLAEGMRVADLGCGVGVVTRMLAEMVGPSGSVTGVDLDPAQLTEAARLCAGAGLENTSFVAASACDTGLPRASFDLVYCRFLLIHLPDPEACLREMRDLLRPGGILVVEDGDLAAAGSIPPTALDAFGDLWPRLGPSRGVDYRLGTRLYHLVRGAGFDQPNIEIHQPAIVRGPNRVFLEWSVAEAGPAFVAAGLVSEPELAATLAAMRAAIADPDVVVLAPRMSLVWARKAPRAGAAPPPRGLAQPAPA